MAKLIIWDLDETLWSGTLAEGDAIELFEARVHAIRQLNSRGVVHSICSKNDATVAEKKLRELGIWEEFVFPTIDFSPKGELVRQIIEDMQLRAPDVVFVDDNPSNLAEVAHFNAGISVYDARQQDFDEFLVSLLQRLEGTKKSRVEEYRILEKKRSDRLGMKGSNEEFLGTCNVRVCMVRRTDNLPWATRIEELINRTNQLNFTKSRVPAGSIAEYVIDVAVNETYSVFVWDNYGDYGLVGFAAVEKKSNLRHFLFSCRTMNMGIENAVASVLKKTFRNLKLPVDATQPSWIRFVDSESEEFKDVLRRAKSDTGRPIARVMANCQSGAIAHYMGLPDVAFDNWPRIFKIEDALAGNTPVDTPVLVYGAFMDYDNRYWSKTPTDAQFGEAALRFVEAVQTNQRQVLVILPPESFSVEDPKLGITQERFARLNGMWRGIADEYSSVKLIDLCRPEFAWHGADPRHFERETLRLIGQRAREEVAKVEAQAVVG